MKTAVLILNIFGLNWISRFITGHIGTGILVLLIDIFSVVFFNGFGWILFIIGCIIWVVDLVTVCTNKWECNGEYLGDWSGDNIERSYDVNVNLNSGSDSIDNFGNTRNITTISNSLVNNIHNDHKKCPFCAELIKKEAILCRFCGSNIQESEDKQKTMQAEIEEKKIDISSMTIEEKDSYAKQLREKFESCVNNDEKLLIAKELVKLGYGYYARYL